MDPVLQSLIGFFLFYGMAWAASENRRAIPWRMVISGMALQAVMGVLFLKLPAFREFSLLLNDGLMLLEKATRQGTGFVFGYLGGGPLPFAESSPGSSFVLAFQALPIVLVVSALSSLLFHWRVLPLIVRGLSALLERTLGVGGAVGMSTAANVFVGMVEAPLLIRPYLAAVSRGEMFIIMTVGMAGIAGTVMVLYASILGPVVPDAIGHIIVSSFISAPAAIAIAALMVPPTGPATGGGRDLPSASRSSMDAITRGTVEGMQLLLQIVAMLVVLVALVNLVNLCLGLLPDIAGRPLSLQRMLGALMAPLVWLAGIPWSEAPAAGALMGTKTVLNELIAYIDLSRLPPDELSPRSRLIMTYALCGFANFGSLGILIGGLNAMAPERRSEILALGPRTLVSGTLATLCCGSLVGILL